MLLKFFVLQLINIFSCKELRSLIPEPDLKELEERLKRLQRNIYKSFPYTRYGSSRDAFCYRRVNTHLTTFKVSIWIAWTNAIVYSTTSFFQFLLVWQILCQWEIVGRQHINNRIFLEDFDIF